MRWHGILVSVRSADEARAALAGGAAIVDVKDPEAGPLGRPSAVVSAAVAEVVADRRPWTLAIGELAAGPAAIVAHLRAVAGLATGDGRPPRAVKAGPAGLDADGWRAGMAVLRDALPDGIEPVAVAYADWEAAAAPEPAAIVAAAAATGLRTLLIDTFIKDGRGLFASAGIDAVRGWVAEAHRRGLDVALAGSLTAADVPRAVACGAGVVAVRTAACSGGRLGTVAEERVRGLVTLFAAADASSVVPAAAGAQP